MPVQEETLETIKPEEPKLYLNKGLFNPRVLIFGIPVFIIQLIIVYYITANILMKKFENRESALQKNDLKTATINNVPNTQVELGKYIYPIDDIIVNPADTDGKRLLLTSVGIDVAKLEMQNDLKAREPLVKDVIISTLASKDIDHLDNTLYRDTLKIEITSKLKKLLPGITVNNIYFSKYIIQ